jgi:hypothetical protein
MKAAEASAKAKNGGQEEGGELALVKTMKVI